MWALSQCGRRWVGLRQRREGGWGGEGHEDEEAEAADGGGILIYYGRDWLMLIWMSVVIIEERGRKRPACKMKGCFGSVSFPVHLLSIQQNGCSSDSRSGIAR